MFASKTRGIWTIGAIILLGATLCRGQAPATQPAPATTQPSAQVIGLVNDLGSDDFATRQSAQKKLEQMGISVEPQLRAVLLGQLTDEVRARIESALNHIQENHDFGPSVITLHYRNAPLINVLDDFATQAGADLGVHRPEIRNWVKSRTASIDVDNGDFWTTLRQIETVSGLHIRPGEGDMQMILDRNGGGWFNAWDNGGPSAIAGPCIITVTSAGWNLQYGPNGNNSHSSSLQLMAMLEPKLRVVGQRSPNWLKECVDEKGNSLVPTGMQPNYFPMNSQRSWLQLSANLLSPKGMGTQIARLRGELDFSIQTKSEVVEVDQLASVHDLVKTAGGNTITIQHISVDGGQCQLHLTVRGAAASGQWDLIQNLIASLQVLDDKDRPLQQSGTSTNSIGNGQMNIMLSYNTNFPGVGPPAKLRWEITTDTRDLKVPFELDNIEHSPL